MVIYKDTNSHKENFVSAMDTKFDPYPLLDRTWTAEYLIQGDFILYSYRGTLRYTYVDTSPRNTDPGNHKFNMDRDGTFPVSMIPVQIYDHVMFNRIDDAHVIEFLSYNEDTSIKLYGVFTDIECDDKPRPDDPEAMTKWSAVFHGLALMHPDDRAHLASILRGTDGGTNMVLSEKEMNYISKIKDYCLVPYSVRIYANGYRP